MPWWDVGAETPTLRRVDVPELMDAPDADPCEVRRSLRDLASVNRFLGGTAVLLRHLRRALAGVRMGQAVSLLDVGTGAADVPAAIVERGERCGYRVWVVGLERGRAAIGVARERVREGVPVRLVRGDALALPFRDGSFDVAISSTTFHHFSGSGALRFLTELWRVSRRGVVLGDLRRSVLGYLAARALAATLWRRHRYARHDGPASVRRAYTVGEMREMLRRAGLEGRVRRHRFFRLGVWIRR